MKPKEQEQERLGRSDDDDNMMKLNPHQATTHS